MASLAPAATVSIWKRVLANLTTFAEAAETDGFAYYDLRIVSLERRIGALEGAADKADVGVIAVHRAGPQP